MLSLELAGELPVERFRPRGAGAPGVRVPHDASHEDDSSMAARGPGRVRRTEVLRACWLRGRGAARRDAAEVVPAALKRLLEDVRFFGRTRAHSRETVRKARTVATSASQHDVWQGHQPRRAGAHAPAAAPAPRLARLLRQTPAAAAQRLQKAGRTWSDGT
jgi:hypothetical protein